MSKRTNLKITPLIVAFVLLTAAPAFAGKIIYVDDDAPADFREIQAAINDANEGDEIVVSIGTYYENIDFDGKNITLRSKEPKNPVAVANTIIDGRHGGSVVTFSGTESSACVLSGFTITNGRGTGVGYNYGGGIYGNGTLATIQNNIISGNRTASPIWPCSGFGGGLYDCDGTIRCNIISGNGTICDEGSASGGGLFGCDGTIQNNIITNNSALGFGFTGGGGLGACNGNIQNNTIFGNLAGNYGGGLSGCNGTITNCIIWQNTAAQEAQISASSTPSYSCIQDWTGGGIGNINYDPCFVDPTGSDYHLSLLSPCINAGDPCYSPAPEETDIYGEPRIINSCVDMGADEVDYEGPLVRVSPRKVEFLSYEHGSNPEQKTLSIWNGGIDAINWQIIENSRWLDVWPTSGASTGQINEVILTVDASGLGIGSYTCTLEVRDPSVINSPETVTVTLHIFSEVIYVPKQVRTIQEAIDHVLDGGNVIVADGIYTGEGNRDINFRGKAITVRSNNGPKNCIIDCNGTETEPHRGFYFDSGETPDSQVEGLTIMNGWASEVRESLGVTGGAIFCFISSPSIKNCIIMGSSADLGGGMYNRSGNPILTNCTFSNNSAASNGGGMYNYDGSGSTITNCVFSGNSADAGGGIFNWVISQKLTNCAFIGNSAKYGGGMYNLVRSNPTITNCDFIGNQANSRGGGVYNNSSSSPTITNCSFSDNSASNGGGMYNYNYSSPIIINCVFSENLAEYSGGGMSNYDYSSPTVTNCTFDNNSAGRGGGGMHNSGEYSNTKPKLTDCTFSGNSAGLWGGGMTNSRSDPYLTNCIFSGNLTGSEGGGMFNSWYCNLTITNCTFIGNLAAECGAGIFNVRNSSTLTSCIMWGNTATQGNAIYLATYSVPGKVYPTEVTLGYSDVQGSLAGIHVEAGCTLNWSLGNIDVDPCFVEPGYWDSNGTPKDANDDVWVDGNYHLLPGSPCIDAGDPDYIPGPDDTDLDGRPRVIGGRVDMGVYEYRHLVPAEIRIIPRTISLAKKGKWITAFLWFLEDYNVADIDPNSIFLEEQIKGEQILVNEENQVVIAKFYYSDVQTILSIGDVELTITAQLTDGTFLEGIDVIKVIHEGGGKFAKLSGKAINPNPADGETNVDETVDLSWTSGSNATSRDVYFGTSNPPPFIGNRTETTFDPGTMDYRTTYYWRIDEIKRWGTTTGQTWTFTTLTEPPPPPPQPPT